MNEIMAAWRSAGRPQDKQVPREDALPPRNDPCLTPDPIPLCSFCRQHGLRNWQKNQCLEIVQVATAFRIGRPRQLAWGTGRRTGSGSGLVLQDILGQGVV